MLNYKLNKNCLNLKKNFDFLYLKELINNSAFIIYFNYNKISNKDLYSLKNELLKKNLKSFMIETIHVNSIFNCKLKFLSSHTFFICCNNISNFLFVTKLLNNIKFFFLYNKYFSTALSSSVSSSVSSGDDSMILNANLNNIHFIIFKLVFSVLIIILIYIINLIRNINNKLIK